MRRSGTTTRIIDSCVQEFFISGITKCVDHNNTKEQSLALQKKVLARLKFEHRLIEGVHFRKAFNETENIYIIINLKSKEDGRTKI